MNIDAARARLFEAQRLLLEAQEELIRFPAVADAQMSAADSKLRVALVEIANARHELREPPPQVSPETF